ncbi:MAG TPA: hypothetical protein VFH75_01235 [Actinomycetota bacterium]|nr:hypothetical protein [Actinomycetota bacterium]
MDKSPVRGPSRSRGTAHLGRGGALSVLVLAASLTACEGRDTRGFRNPVLPSISPYTPAPPPECQYPKKLKFPKWLPRDLPFPAGTYTQERLQSLEGYRRAILVIPVNLDELTQHVLNAWPRAGWTLGAGDSEPGEIEDQFSKAPAFGAFRARGVYCEPGYSLMYIIFTRNRSAPGPVSSPRGSPLVPSPTPTG